jgi:hypothetical protein
MLCFIVAWLALEAAFRGVLDRPQRPFWRLASSPGATYGGGVFWLDAKWLFLANATGRDSLSYQTSSKLLDSDLLATSNGLLGSALSAS